MSRYGKGNSRDRGGNVREHVIPVYPWNEQPKLTTGAKVVIAIGAVATTLLGVAIGRSTADAAPLSPKPGATKD